MLAVFLLLKSLDTFAFCVVVDFFVGGYAKYRKDVKDISKRKIIQEGNDALRF